MHSTLILAAAEVPDKFSHSVIDGLPHLAGMLMVMVTLAILWGICAFTAKLVATFAPAPAAAAPVARAAAPAPAPPSAPLAAGTPPEIVAVIAAAVATVAGRSSRVVSIRRIDTSWEKAGRQAVLTSHRIR
jgi:Na+-transporting methylmalonyl-CoA/oxaloacetate decarboxylase gamma subunit